MLSIMARSMDGVEIPIQIFQSRYGVDIPVQKLQSESSLAQSQRALVTMFQKALRSTWAAVVIDNVAYSEPDDKPFVDLREGMTIQICFEPPHGLLKVRLLFDEQIIPMMARRSMYLSDVWDYLYFLKKIRWTWWCRPILLCQQQNLLCDEPRDLSLKMYSK